MQLSRCLRAISIITMAALISIALGAGAAVADGSSLAKGPTSVKIKAWKNKVSGDGTGGGGTEGGRSAKPKYTYVSKGEYAKRQKAFEADLERVIRVNFDMVNAQIRCNGSPTAMACPGIKLLDLPADFTYRPAGDPAKPTAPVVSPQQAAYIAMARLRLTPPQPMIGPPPSINQWKMAAVGYPMWLWADGTLNPAPVTDTVYDLTVTLDARLATITYTMGDGHKISCTDNTRRWTRTIPAAKPSPACGYTYQKPSLPKGDYTITAHTVWAVDWTVNGVRGTIAFYQSATTQLPVGELQVLTR